jgi:hypothetical protein
MFVFLNQLRAVQNEQVSKGKSAMIPLPPIILGYVANEEKTESMSSQHWPSYKYVLSTVREQAARWSKFSYFSLFLPLANMLPHHKKNVQSLEPKYFLKKVIAPWVCVK